MGINLSNLIKMKLFQLLILQLALICDVQGQDLPRRGSLGVQFHVLTNQQGIRIDRSFPNTTAVGLKAQQGDVIKTINGKQIVTQDDLLQSISQWREGDQLIFIIERNGQRMKLRGKVVPKPKEKPRVGSIVYTAVKYRDGYLRAILNKPEGIANPPCIFYLQGFGCTSMDYYYRTSVIRLLVEGLVEKGYAVYRLEKPGVGDSNNSEACNEIGYHDEIEAFNNGLNTLKTRKDIDVENIFLFGSSLGGVTATAIAAGNPVRGIIKWGSLFLPIYEHGLRRLDIQAADYGIRKQVYFEYFINRKMPKTLAINKRWGEVMSTDRLLQWDGTYILNRDPRYMMEVNDVATPDSLKKVKCPVLAIHGEYDVNIGDSEWAEKTAQTINSIMPGKGKFVILPHTNHGYTKVASMQENIRLTENAGFTPEYQESNFNYDLINILAEWVSKNTI